MMVPVLKMLGNFDEDFCISIECLMDPHSPNVWIIVTTNEHIQTKQNVTCNMQINFYLHLLFYVFCKLFKYNML